MTLTKCVVVESLRLESLGLITRLSVVEAALRRINPEYAGYILYPSRCT
jgi:hypothetical protein